MDAYCVKTASYSRPECLMVELRLEVVLTLSGLNNYEDGGDPLNP